MKTLLSKPLQTAAVLLLALGSCKKEGQRDISRHQPLSATSGDVSLLTYYDFGTDILEEDFLLTVQNDDELQYNYVEYALTTGLLEIFHNHPGLLQELVTQVSGSPNSCYNLFTFADAYPEVNLIFDSAFAARLDDFGSYGSWRTYVEANYKYDVHYLPFARVVNTGAIDYDKTVMVAAPFEIDEEKFAGFNNHIPLWLKSDTGTTLFSVVNKELAGLIDNPILLISNGHEGDEIVTYDRAPAVSTTSNVLINCLMPTHHHEYLNHQQFKINERYEGTGSSEYVFVWAGRAAYRHDIRDWVGHYETGRRDIEVKKDEIGTLLHQNFITFSPDMFNPAPKCFEIAGLAAYPQLYHCYAVGAYEEDWYAGWKRVLTTRLFQGPYPPENEQRLDGKRKFDNEWYYFDPATNDSYPFNTRNPTQHSTYYNYTKGELRLHRWNY